MLSLTWLASTIGDLKRTGYLDSYPSFLRGCWRQRYESSISFQLPSPEYSTGGEGIWATGLLCLSKVGQSIPQCPGCPSLGNIWTAVEVEDSLSPSTSFETFKGSSTWRFFSAYHLFFFFGGDGVLPGNGMSLYQGKLFY